MTDQTNARIEHLRPPYAPDVEAVLAAMPKAGAEPLKLFRTFAKNLPFVRAIGPIGQFMLSRRDKGGASFDLRSRELVIDRVCARCRCEYEWGVHIAGFANKAGLTEAQIYSTVHGTPGDPCWDERDASVLRMVDGLHDHARIEDSTFDALKAHFDENAIMELLALAGWYHAIAYMLNGMRTELEDWAPRFPAASSSAPSPRP